jgi:hypothetical protein
VLPEVGADQLTDVQVIVDQQHADGRIGGSNRIHAASIRRTRPGFGSESGPSVTERCNAWGLLRAVTKGNNPETLGAGRHGGTLADRCERLGRDHSRLAGAIATTYLDLDATQEGALEPLLAIGNRWREDTQTLCLELAGAESHSVDQGLATMEAFLDRSAGTAGELRAAWRDFEAQLTPAQQATITAMLSRHHPQG